MSALLTTNNTVKLTDLVWSHYIMSNPNNQHSTVCVT